MLPVEIVSQIGTDYTCVVVCPFHGSKANERHLVLEMASRNLTSAHVIKVEIGRSIKHPTAIHLGNDGESTVVRRNVGLKCIADFWAIPFNPFVNTVGFSEIYMITTGQSGIEAMFGKIGIVKIIIF